MLHIILLAMAALVAALTSGYWQNTRSEFAVAAICIVLAGIPHGALDHLVAGTTRKGFRLVPYLLLYMASILLYLLVWWLLPGFAFLFFLLITAWHFGETDLACFGNRKASRWQIILYGVAIALWLLMHDQQTLLYWTALLSRESSLAIAVVTLLGTVPNLTWLGLAGLLLWTGREKKQIPVLPTFLFLLFLFTLQYTSLITGFVLYFTGWHSINALTHIRQQVFGAEPFRTMLLKAMVPTLGAICFLAAIVWLGNGLWLQHNGLPALFILLSVLTLPHMTEMHRLYRST
ncbi:MAG TPA: Brp/Blh family beta-carotene 15,15'-dioxygenase [Lacibacter sp.]|nr:Brp/Blh family beta-carotene 15,15'-dioxygenase [Lacibacter sp.]HMO88153.1 Brp/Blh family beta-carotene 15,15'-dioxygenase [Lacibacter sp.]HMP86010.1 Brp/Blh family beta-carotene 15,15'-dioxygenase [Lacibacter sp.]